MFCTTAQQRINTQKALVGDKKEMCWRVKGNKTKHEEFKMS